MTKAIMSKIWVIVLTVLTSSCTKLLENFGYTEMSVNIVNDSGLPIKKVGFYAWNSSDASRKHADSTIVENILMSNSKQFEVKRKNKMGGEGDFEVKQDSILVKSTFRK